MSPEAMEKLAHTLEMMSNHIVSLSDRVSDLEKTVLKLETESLASKIRSKREKENNHD